eukprot:COSAG05_NODE_2338_length_3213_cov_1.894990_3_plen_92_part_00
MVWPTYVCVRTHYTGKDTGAKPCTFKDKDGKTQAWPYKDQSQGKTHSVSQECTLLDENKKCDIDSNDSYRTTGKNACIELCDVDCEGRRAV